MDQGNEQGVRGRAAALRGEAQPLTDEARNLPHVSASTTTVLPPRKLDAASEHSGTRIAQRAGRTGSSGRSGRSVCMQRPSAPIADAHGLALGRPPRRRVEVMTLRHHLATDEAGAADGVRQQLGSRSARLRGTGDAAVTPSLASVTTGARLKGSAPPPRLAGEARHFNGPIGPFRRR